MDPLRVKWWGQKHLGPSYICELNLHPKFRSTSITPSHKKLGRQKEEETSLGKRRTLVPILPQFDIHIASKLQKLEKRAKKTLKRVHGPPKG